MSNVLGAVEIQMLADLARLKADMDQAKSLVGNAAKEMQRAADMVKTALGAIGVGLSAAALVGWVRSAIDAADAMDEMSSRVGIGAGELSKLQVAYKMAGLDQAAMQSSLSKLSKEIATGNAAFDQLGIKTRNADGTLRSATAVLRDVADKFAGMIDGTAKTALAMEIFGKSGADMVGVLNGGSEALDEMARMAERLGVAITDEAAADAAKFNDTLDLLSMGMQGIGSQVASRLLPTLNGLAGAFLSSMTEGDRLSRIADVLATGLKVLYAVGVSVVEAFSMVGKTIGAAGAQIMAVMQGDFAGAVRIGNEWAADMKAGWSSAAANISAAWNGTAADSTAAMASIVKGSQDVVIQSKAQEEAAKKLAAEEAKRAEEVKKLIGSIEGKIAAQQLDLATGEKLSESEKLALDTMVKLRDGTLKLTEAETIALSQKLESLLVGEREIKQREEAKKATEAMATWQTKWAADQDKTTEGLRAQVVEQQRANDELRLGADAIAQREIAQMRATATDLEWAAANEGGNQALEEQARLLRKRADLAEEGVALKEAKAARDEWQKTVDSIGQGLTDSLYRAFESGRDFFSTLWDGIANTFKTTVLKIAVQAVMSPVNQVLGSMFSAGSAAGGGLLGLLGNAGGLAGMLGSFGGYGMTGLMSTLSGTGLGTSLGAAGSLMGSGNVAGGLGMGAGALAPVLGLIGLGMGLADKAFAAGNNEDNLQWTKAWTATGGLAPPTLKFDTNFLQKLGFSQRTANILTGASLWSSVFGDKSATLGYGGALIGDSTVTGTSGKLMDFGRGNNAYSQDLQDYAAALATQLGDVAKGFGGSAAGLQVFVGTDQDREGRSAGTVQFLRSGSRLGGIQTGGGDPLITVAGKIAAGDLGAWFADNTSQALLAGLQHAGLDQRFAEYFKSFAALDLTKDEADAVLATASGVRQLTDSLEPLGGVFSRLSSLSVKATVELANLTGGVDAFAAKSQAYVQAYYTQDEQLALVAREVRSQLTAVGINTDTLFTKEAYRSMVDSRDLGTTQGREQLATLLNNASAFAQLAESLGGRTLAELAAMAPSGALFDTTDSAAAAVEAAQASAQQLQAANTQLQAIAQSGTDTVTELQALVRLQSEANRQLVAQLAAMSAAMDEAARPALLADLSSNPGGY